MTTEQHETEPGDRFAGHRRFPSRLGHWSLPAGHRRVSPLQSSCSDGGRRTLSGGCDRLLEAHDSISLVRVSCVKELAGLDLDIAGLRTCTFSLRLVRISPYWVSATAQVTAVAAGSSRPRRYVKGSLPYAHPLGVVVNRPSVA